MPEIILTDEQSQVVCQASGTVLVRDRQGRCWGYLTVQTGFTPDEIAEAEKRAASDGPWYTTQEVRDHLRSLDRS